MTLLYLSIPFMLIGIAMALAPLLWAMTHSERLHEATVPDPVPHHSRAGDGAPEELAA